VTTAARRSPETVASAILSRVEAGIFGAALPRIWNPLRLRGLKGSRRTTTGVSMRVLTVLAALGLTLGGFSIVFADPGDAAYNDGGTGVLGNFSHEAYSPSERAYGS